MSDRPEWFSAKRYGYGFNLPIAWQGWAVFIAYALLLYLAAQWLDHSSLPFWIVVIALTALFLWIVARTTKGGWRWRWGDPD
jgi:hypothetical protein